MEVFAEEITESLTAWIDGQEITEGLTVWMFDCPACGVRGMEYRLGQAACACGTLLEIKAKPTCEEVR